MIFKLHFMYFCINIRAKGGGIAPHSWLGTLAFARPWTLFLQTHQQDAYFFCMILMQLICDPQNGRTFMTYLLSSQER